MIEIDMNADLNGMTVFHSTQSHGAVDGTRPSDRTTKFGPCKSFGPLIQDIEVVSNSNAIEFQTVRDLLQNIPK